MGLYLISYDLNQPGRNYAPVYTLLGQWSAKRLLESVWLVSTNLGAIALRDALMAVMDPTDAVAVIELKPSSVWATTRTQAPGSAWLQQYIP